MITVTHPTLAEQLTTQREALAEAARRYAHGTMTQSELEEAAVDFTNALEAKAMENLRSRK